jgi:hypothetical protein
MKTERLTTRITADQKNFLTNTFDNISAGFNHVIEDYIALRRIARMEIALIDLSEMDLMIPCDADINTVHPADFKKTLALVAKKHQYSADKLSDKLENLSLVTKYLLKADVRDYDIDTLKNWYSK